MDQINACGNRAAERHNNLTYWTYNWRKHGGSERMYKISKEEPFTNRSIAGVCIHYVIPINGGKNKS